MDLSTQPVQHHLRFGDDSGWGEGGWGGGLILSLAGAATFTIGVLSRQTHMRQKYACRDKSMLAVTKVCLL